MCNVCGCTSGLDGMSKVEAIKAASRGLRGTLAEELTVETPTFSDAAVQVLKFHGVYQQDDRDLRKEARKLGLDKHYQMMIRTRIPGGVVSPEAYLAHDAIAGRWGNGTLRVTTRQDFQLHGVLKGDLRSSIRAINDSLLTTLGGCGDQERNIMCCPAPIRDRLREEAGRVLGELVHALTPATRAYHEIWLDGELAASSEPEPDPLYGDRYLPRKFKTAVAVEGDNCVDVYANDLALVARGDRDAGLTGFEVLVGGGLGRTRNKPDTFPTVARPMAFVEPRQVVELSRAVVGVHRDFGNRGDRRHARLKYLVRERGLEWFRDRVQERVPFELLAPRALQWRPVDDHLGWHEQGVGLSFLGIHVENGRIADGDDALLRTGIREAVARFRPQVRLTAQQNVILAGLRTDRRKDVESVLAAHGVRLVEGVHTAIRNSMACPAWPTCGLAVAESERVMPALMRRIAPLLDRLGMSDERISFRMTGCPNGCARPYLGDVGFVGTTLGKYDVFLGGDFGGTRLNELYAESVALEDIPGVLRGPLTAFKRERRPAQGFGDWCAEVGLEALRRRFLEARP